MPPRTMTIDRSSAEMGEFTLARFTAAGVAHEVAITGASQVDTERLARDLKRLCRPRSVSERAPQPHRRMDHYVSGNGRGEDTAVWAPRSRHCRVPATTCRAGDDEQAKNRGFLGLCSHEYFHTWNVKRIKPAAFAPYDLQVESHSPLLWLFEGFTSYYDDLMLVRAGVIGEPAYFKLLAKTIGGVLRGSGRSKQSVAESSFDAWTKYYRQDENAPNAIVSYYIMVRWWRWRRSEHPRQERRQEVARRRHAGAVAALRPRLIPLWGAASRRPRWRRCSTRSAHAPQALLRQVRAWHRRPAAGRCWRSSASGTATSARPLPSLTSTPAATATPQAVQRPRGARRTRPACRRATCWSPSTACASRRPI